MQKRSIIGIIIHRKKLIGDYIVKEENRNNHKPNIKVAIIIIFALIIVIVCARYLTDEEFRGYIDTNILKKEVAESTLNTIEIDSETNPAIYSYDKYITILSKNKLKEYTSDGKKEAELEVNIAVPLIESNGKYMVIAEKDGKKIYLISGTNILWDTEVEGTISNINVNKNGYVSVVIKNTTYKSVVAFFDLSGKELFRTYLSTSYVVCTDISPNNKYLAIGEVDYSGTVIKSDVKIISVDNAQKDPENSIIYTYESDSGEIITNMNYQNKDFVLCMFNKYVQKIAFDSNERLYDIKENDLFVDINLNDNIAIVDKQSSGLFSYEYEVVIKNTNNKSESLYILNSDLPKTISTSGNNIALNLGNEVQIVNSNGWMLKRYTSSKQIKGLVIGDSIAGIIYKNKVEIVNL